MLDQNGLRGAGVTPFGRAGERDQERITERVLSGAAPEADAGAKANPTIPATIRRAVAARDGWRCRYCRIRVVSSATLTKLEQLLPAARPRCGQPRRAPPR